MGVHIFFMVLRWSIGNFAHLRTIAEEDGMIGSSLRHWLFVNFGWDVYEWGEDEIRF